MYNHLNDSGLVHGDAIVGVSGELMQRQSGGSMYVRVLATKILHQRRYRVFASESNAIVSP